MGMGLGMTLLIVILLFYLQCINGRLLDETGEDTSALSESVLNSSNGFSSFNTSNKEFCMGMIYLKKKNN